MTGFARVSGATANFRWAWELKSVNAKGLDLRLRLPPGFDAIEAEARAALGKKLTRGTCYATLSAQREAVTPEVYLNEGLLRRLAEAISHVGNNDTLRPASIDGLLGVRGVIEIRDAGDEESDLLAVQRAALEGLGKAVTALVGMREQEGGALASILTQRLARLTVLRQAAEDCPGAQARGGSRQARRIGRAARRAEQIRRDTALSGGAAAGRQGRRARGTRPARDPYRSGHRAFADRWPDRPAARFSRPGARARGKYALRQIE